LTVSSCLWDVQDSPIFCRVSDVNPHFVLRSFHVPLVMVHPWVGWARVVNPSCVMTVEPCMFSSHRRDFCWIWTHPSPLSDVGRASFSEFSRSVILMFESVIRGGWLTMSGGGSWCQFTAGGEGSVGATQVPITYFCDHSFSKSVTVCVSGGGCVPVEARSASQSVMHVEMAGCRYRAVCLPICVSVLFVTSSVSLSSGNPVPFFCLIMLGASWLGSVVLDRSSL
jgi:hypothetical protein